MRYKFIKKSHFVYPMGKPMAPHLLRYQGLAVDDYGFALDASNLGHPRRRRASLDFRSIRVLLLRQLSESVRFFVIPTFILVLRLFKLPG